jgi:hypothetical protein
MTTRDKTPAGYNDLNAPGDVGSQHREDQQQANRETLNISADIQQA